MDTLGVLIGNDGSLLEDINQGITGVVIDTNGGPEFITNGLLDDFSGDRDKTLLQTYDVFCDEDDENEQEGKDVIVKRGSDASSLLSPMTLSSATIVEEGPCEELDGVDGIMFSYGDSGMEEEGRMDIVDGHHHHRRYLLQHRRASDRLDVNNLILISDVSLDDGEIEEEDEDEEEEERCLRLGREGDARDISSIESEHSHLSSTIISTTNAHGVTSPTTPAAIEASPSSAISVLNNGQFRSMASISPPPSSSSASCSTSSTTSSNTEIVFMSNEQCKRRLSGIDETNSIESFESSSSMFSYHNHHQQQHRQRNYHRNRNDLIVIDSGNGEEEDGLFLSDDGQLSIIESSEIVESDESVSRIPAGMVTSIDGFFIDKDAEVGCNDGGGSVGRSRGGEEQEGGDLFLSSSAESTSVAVEDRTLSIVTTTDEPSEALSIKVFFEEEEEEEVHRRLSHRGGRLERKIIYISDDMHQPSDGFKPNTEPASSHPLEGQMVQLEDGTVGLLTFDPDISCADQIVKLSDGSVGFIISSHSKLKYLGQKSTPKEENYIVFSVDSDGGMYALEEDMDDEEEEEEEHDEHHRLASSRLMLEGDGHPRYEFDVESKHRNDEEDIMMCTEESSMLLSSVSSSHDDEEETLQKKNNDKLCKQCNKTFSSPHHLRVHERIHTGVRPFKCPIVDCDKSFSTQYSRKAHIRTHTGEKPYRCSHDGCAKSFKTSGDLQKHVRTHTGERPFLCPVKGCARSFTTSNIRKVHIRTHTGERPYVCPQQGCDKSFASATNYKNHIRIHSGEKPFICRFKECDKRFTEYSSLYKHVLVHSNVRPFVCEQCPRAYRQQCTLNVHKKTSHEKPVKTKKK